MSRFCISSSSFLLLFSILPSKSIAAYGNMYDGIYGPAPASVTNQRVHLDATVDLSAMGHGLVDLRRNTRFLLDGFSGYAEAPAPGDEPVAGPVLAGAKTRRSDPLDSLKAYDGGWNLTNRHYISSVAYAATPWFASAAIWFIAYGIFFIIFFMVRHCKRNDVGKIERPDRTCRFFVATCIALLFAKCCIVVALVSQHKFHSVYEETIESMESRADPVTERLREIAEYIAESRTIEIFNISFPNNTQSYIAMFVSELYYEAGTLPDGAKRNTAAIMNFLDSMKLVLYFVMPLIFLLLCGLLVPKDRRQIITYAVVVIGWMIVTGAFVLCGVFFIIHIVAEDSCLAMGEWLQNPIGHTAVDNILPCMDNSTTSEALFLCKNNTVAAVDLINEVLTNCSNINFAPAIPRVYYNQSGSLVPQLCNPFNHDLTPRSCRSGEIDLANATQVLGLHVCQVSSHTGFCSTEGRLTPALYEEMASAVNISISLNNSALFLEGVNGCQYAKDAISETYTDSCPQLKVYSKWTLNGVAAASISIVPPLILYLFI